MATFYSLRLPKRGYREKSARFQKWQERLTLLPRFCVSMLKKRGHNFFDLHSTRRVLFPPSRPLHHHRCPSTAAPTSLFFAEKRSPLQPPSVVTAPSVGTPFVSKTLHCCSEIQSSTQPPSIVGAPSVGLTSVIAPSSSRHPPRCALRRRATPRLPSSLSSSRNPSSASLLPG
ncbi:hypothetical protein PIB30_035278 [Stylosanthes scabra]|uniref:Uncharacterized protein n=1 Tax=Stylosanthes scabra TaxID=79078 RepID=A0ABU6XES8_9FABA|nr:hypothetical protein [Stylosanthes scabra]